MTTTQETQSLESQSHAKYPYDIVWFSNKYEQTKAYDLITKLPDNEILTRRIHEQAGLRFWFESPIPTSLYTYSSSIGTVVVRNFYGSSKLQPGCLKWMKEWLLIREIEPGLVCANIRPEFYKQQVVIDEADNIMKVEKKNLERFEETFQQSVIKQKTEVSELVKRWKVTLCNILNVKNKDISLEDMNDVCAMAMIAKQDVSSVSLNEWLAVMGQGVSQVPEPPQQSDLVISKDPLSEAKAILSASQRGIRGS